VGRDRREGKRESWERGGDVMEKREERGKWGK